MIQSLASNHLADQGVMLATAVSLWGKRDLPFVQQVKNKKAFEKISKDQRGAVTMAWDRILSSWDRGMNFAKDFDTTQKKMIQSGEKLYFEHCTSCHGANGKGVQVPGTDQYLAPSLVDSQRVHGDPEKLIPLFFHGMMGPIEGKELFCRIYGTRQSFWNRTGRPPCRTDQLYPLRLGKRGRLRGKGSCVPDKKKASGPDFSLDG